MSKTLLIGWDAADWQLINPLIEKGLMPAFARLKNQGASGNMATLRPVLSPMLWTSIATGKRAYKHGIHGFVQVNPATAEIESVKVTTRKSHAVWNILNAAQLKTNVVNWWPSHPAEAVNGVYVSNRFHLNAPAYGKEWPLNNQAIHPPEWKKPLQELRLHPAELTLAHIEPFLPKASTLDPEKDKVLKSTMRILAQACSVHNAATELMAKTDWDFMAVYQEALDHFSHLAMKFHPPKLEGISKRDFDFYNGIVTAAYRFHDMMLERLLDLAGADANVILVSDHGFESGNQRTSHLPDVPAAPALEHRKFGVFLASGPAFKKQETVYGASLLDLTPTILHLHDLPVGEDMDGRVLKSIFVTEKPVSKIETWEDVIPKNTTAESPKTDGEAAVLEQLEAIGYVELPEKNKQQYVQYELTYNLIESLIDGEQWSQAQQKVEVLFAEHKDHRSAKLLLHILHRTAKLSAFDNVLSELKSIVGVQHPDVIYFTGLSENMHGNFEEALANFLVLEEAGALSVSLSLQIARSFYLAQKFEQTEAYAKKALTLDSESVAAHTLLGEAFLEQRKFEDAVAELTKSVGLQFYQPQAHFALAKAFKALGKTAEFEKALNITLGQAPKHREALTLSKHEFKVSNKKDFVIVVSGFPRSGTSMLMQMLGKGGVELYSDQEREADDSNPMGYFELEKVKRLPQNAEWISEASGKAIKVVSPLLRYLPADLEYYVIEVQRPMVEVLLSQEKMKGNSPKQVLKNFPYKLAMDFEEEQRRVQSWIAKQPNLHRLTLEYAEVIENPKSATEALKRFLPISFSAEAAATAVEENLYRSKLQ